MGVATVPLIDRKVNHHRPPPRHDGIPRMQIIQSGTRRQDRFTRR
jgi:hypothetical protein